MSELALRLINECYDTKNPYLDLGRCGLSDEHFAEDSLIDLALSKCTHLETLVLGNEWWDYNTNETVKSLNAGTPNQLTIIPPAVASLTQLMTFVCCGNYGNAWKITDLSPLSGLVYLRSVNISYNQISIMQGLGALTALQQLDLSVNQITELKGLDNLTALQLLDLSRNQIPELKGLDNLTALQLLNLHSNKITELKGLDNLTALQQLYLYNNQIPELKGLHSLTTLQLLYLSHNQITEIKGLHSLTALQQLDLSANQIPEIKGLHSLTALQLLDLSANQIPEIKGLDNLTALQQLYLYNNQITEIKDFSKSGILTLDNLEIVELFNNPVVKNIPPEVVMTGWKAIRDRLLSSDEPVIFREVKILLLGNTNVGKSFLLKYLKTRKVPVSNKSTHGIQYICLSNVIKDTRLHCWDFGGQEYFHATHQLFFSPGALHIVLWTKDNVHRDPNNPEAGFDLHYWLRCIEQLIPKAVKQAIEVIVVENKIDLNEFIVTPLNQHLYKDKYNHFNFHFTNFSIEKRKRLHDFEEIMKERVEKLYTPHSPVYKRYLETIQGSSKDTLSLKEIDPDTESVQTAMEVFHKMGLLLYFPDIIRNTVFIKPQALLNFLYTQILGRAREAVITDTKIKDAIKNNRWDLTFQQIVSLLQHFDLVFQIPERTGHYYIPQYLKEAPLLVDFFERHYFREANIRIESDHYLMNLAMLKVFTRYGGYVKRNNNNEQLFWKDGIIIDKNEALLMIKFNRPLQRIELFPDINHKNFELQKEVVKFILSSSSRQLKQQGSLAKDDKYTKPYLRDNKDSDINQPIIEEQKENTEEINWGNDDFAVQISLDGKFFTTWSKLNENVNNGIFQIETIDNIYNDIDKKIEIKRKTVSVFDYNKYLSKKNKGQMKRLFISYSKDDLPLINKFIEHLAALKMDGLVGHWYCTSLTAGTDWHHEIQEHFEQSDIVCFMVSPNFMRTQYIHEHEIKKAFERKDKNPGFKIVPIILDFCKWTTVHNNLGQFTALPYTAKPVVDFKNQNMAWYIIQECLRLMIEKDLNPIGDEFYRSQSWPTDLNKLFERIVEKKADA